MRDVILEKQIVTHVTKKCDIRDAVFLDLFLINCSFFHNIGRVGRSVLKANNVLPF